MTTEIVLTWRNITTNHPVKVRGARGDFKFRNATVKDGEVVSVCVIGGSRDRSLMRHFTPDRIIVRRVTPNK